MNLSKVEKFYTQNLETYGIDSRAVGWNSPESQNLRFEKLMFLVENNSKPFSINELGCGYGELYKYLEKNKFNLEVSKDISLLKFNLYNNSLKGIAFNFLTSYVDYRSEILYYQDPAEMLTFCLDNFGKNVKLVHDYPLYEFTIIVYKS